MRFTSLFSTAVCVLSVSAASLSQRDITGPVELCRNDIDAISNEIQVVAGLLEAFTSSLGYNGANSIHSAEQVLEKALKKAGADCCIVAGKLTHEEADAMLETVTPVIPQATSALDLTVTKKPEIYKVILAPVIAKADITALNSQTVTLYTCIRGMGPDDHPTYNPIIDDFIFQLDHSFAISLDAYKNTTTSGTA